MNRLFLVLFMLVGTQVVGQNFPSEMWHKGQMVLVNEDTLLGKLKYDMEREIVQVQTAEKFYTFSSKQIFYFEIFDETVEFQRRFYTIPYGLVSNYKTPVIFEVLLEGNISILAREKIGVKTSQLNSYSYRYSPNSTYSREVLTYDYYFVDKTGNITQYSMKKKDLLYVLRKREGAVNKFIKANNLHVDRRSDLIRIISFYNGII